MNCKKVQEFITTDYIDGQMGDKQKGLIDQHLAHCLACKQYLNYIKEAAVDPFVNVSIDGPDKFLWAQIKQAIEIEQQHQLEESLKPDFWERIRSAIHIPKPAFAFATIVTMVLMISTTGQLFLSTPVVKVNGQDQVEYLSSLIDEPMDLAGNNGNDPQTPIEKYFL